MRIKQILQLNKILNNKQILRLFSNNTKKKIDSCSYILGATTGTGILLICGLRSITHMVADPND